MNDAEIEQARLQLLRMKAELQELGELAGETGNTVELDQSRVGRLSRMDALQGQQMALEAARRRQQQLQKIEVPCAVLNPVTTGTVLYAARQLMRADFLLIQRARAVWNVRISKP